MKTLTKNGFPSIALIFNKVAIKERSFTKGKEKYFIIIIGSTEKEDITTLNLFACDLLV